MIHPNHLPYKISVIITNYNYGRYLDESVRSALHQDYANKEVIVVDDGSTDNSLEILQKYPSVKVVAKQNGGTASARNAGVQAATGDVYAFLDADDFYHAEKLTKSMMKMAEVPGIGAVYSDYNIIYEEADGSRKFKREFKHPFAFNYLAQSCIVSTNSLVNKEAFHAVGGFDESIKGMEDYDLWLKIAMRYTIVHLPFALFTYREHGKNKTRTTPMTEWMAEEQAVKNRIFGGNR